MAFAEKRCQIHIYDNNEMVFCLRDGSEIVKSWISMAKKDMWTDEMRQSARERMTGNTRGSKKK